MDIIFSLSNWGLNSSLRDLSLGLSMSMSYDMDNKMVKFSPFSSLLAETEKDISVKWVTAWHSIRSVENLEMILKIPISQKLMVVVTFPSYLWTVAAWRGRLGGVWRCQPGSSSGSCLGFCHPRDQTGSVCCGETSPARHEEECDLAVKDFGWTKK